MITDFIYLYYAIATVSVHRYKISFYIPFIRTKTCHLFSWTYCIFSFSPRRFFVQRIMSWFFNLKIFHIYLVANFVTYVWYNLKIFHIYLVATHTPQLDDPIFFILGQETSIDPNIFISLFITNSALWENE